MNRAELGIRIPEFLLPNSRIDLAKWPVVACDQYTSEPEYWRRVAELVGDNPSTFHIIFPEVYLGKNDEPERIYQIQQTMLAYLEQAVLQPVEPGLIWVERTSSHGKTRRGLMVAVDLEYYDFHQGAQSLIRATEGTVLERIPPRVRIREGAAVESPHIMVLIDDPERQVIESLAETAKAKAPLYDIDLMMNGGHLTGCQITDPAAIDRVLAGLAKLADPELFAAKYGVESARVLLMAVGDGNHSLATAKTVWEKIKTTLRDTETLANHPARFAMVELVNVHDVGLEFEPIHRVLFNLDPEQFLGEMQQHFNAFGSETFLTPLRDETAMLERVNAQPESEAQQVIGYCHHAGYGIITVTNPRLTLAVGTLQSFSDGWLTNHPEAQIDYIHGNEVVTSLGRKTGNLGLYLPPMSKQALFRTVIVEGVLPRKTFSMGEAEEKRFYMECRKII